MDNRFKHIIVGAGLAGASAVEGIREIDQDGPILLVGRERHLPYNRPPLSKALWLGEKTFGDIFIHDRDFYADHGVRLALGTTVTELNPKQKSVTLNTGKTYIFDKLLLATGGVPRRLDIPGGALEGIYYYRYLDHYQRLQSEATEGRSALVIGGGFIGSEMAAALKMSDLDVTMIFPESYLVQRIFPAGLGRALQGEYRDRGVQILSNDLPTHISQEATQYVIRTENGKELSADLILAGIGITPSVRLAQEAGLQVDNGIVVNEYLQSSHPDIFAAGDNARFPYIALGKLGRVEHWDNAKHQGRWAGHNMAGNRDKYTYMPYFFSDLFEFGYEAVGEIDSDLETHTEWEKEHETGIIYYLRDAQVRGVMTCNLWDRLDQAREMIRAHKDLSPHELSEAIA